MGWSARINEHGDIEWEIYQSSYGWIGGTSPDERAAQVAMQLAEDELLERPDPRALDFITNPDLYPWHYLPLNAGDQWR